MNLGSCIEKKNYIWVTNCGQNMNSNKIILLTCIFGIWTIFNSCTNKSKCNELFTEDGTFFITKDGTPYTGSCETSVYGIKKIKNFNNGQLSGQLESFTPNGQLLSSTSYREGKRNGWNILYYPNGNKEKEGKYPHWYFFVNLEEASALKLAVNKYLFL